MSGQHVEPINFHWSAPTRGVSSPLKTNITLPSHICYLCPIRVSTRYPAVMNVLGVPRVKLTFMYYAVNCISFLKLSLSHILPGLRLGPLTLVPIKRFHFRKPWAHQQDPLCMSLDLDRSDMSLSRRTVQNRFT